MPVQGCTLLFFSFFTVTYYFLLHLTLAVAALSSDGTHTSSVTSFLSDYILPDGGPEGPQHVGGSNT